MIAAPKKGGKRGFALILMSVSAVALFGALGLAADLGRMFVARNETQAYCDTAALAAALQLDGTASGLSAAQTAIANTGNTWNLATTQIANAQLDFATGAAGPWSTNPTPATGYTYARVRVAVPVQLYFVPVVVKQSTQNVGSTAIAAQIPQTSFSRGLAPYTAVSTDSTSPTLGFTPGDQYSIQWPQYNGARAGCSPGNPSKCFNSPPCSGDSKASQVAVTQYWGASISGYWGSNSNNTIRQEVLDVIQLQPVSVGQQIGMTSGNKNSEAKALDDRVNQDGDVLNNGLTAYLGSSNHNGRRLVALPVVSPTASGTFVIGYGAFLLLSDGSPSNFYETGSGNDPYCALYAGPYVQGSIKPGGSGQTGSFRVALVQ